jgi:hypothetical protein
VSKNSTRNELNCVSKSRMPRNHCPFRLQMQPWPWKSARRSSNSGESVLKKEIPDYIPEAARRCWFSADFAEGTGSQYRERRLD